MKRKIHILYLDDDIHDHQLIKYILRKENKEYKVVEADSREKFEKHLAEEEFDLVLSDFNIPGFYGLQILQFVKEINPEYSWC